LDIQGYAKYHLQRGTVRFHAFLLPYSEKILKKKRRKCAENPKREGKNIINRFKFISYE